MTTTTTTTLFVVYRCAFEIRSAPPTYPRCLSLSISLSIVVFDIKVGIERICVGSDSRDEAASNVECI